MLKGYSPIYDEFQPPTTQPDSAVCAQFLDKPVEPPCSEDSHNGLLHFSIC